MRLLSKGVLLSLLLAPLLEAQTNESLLIKPADVLHVQIFDAPELEEHARVSDAGELQVLLIGNVTVGGMTPAQAAKAIETALLHGNILLHPRAVVSVDSYATQYVSILGEVHTPGAYPIYTPRSILDVLTLAGGLTDLADRKVLIQRQATSQKVPYFLSNAPEVAMDTSVMVNPGDTLFVPKAGIVYVLGDVGHPGGYTMTDNQGTLSTLELLARAGGSNHSAVPSHSVLLRKSGTGYKKTPLPLSEIQKGKKPDLPLQANDIIYVPFSYMRNFVVQGSSIAGSVGSAAVYRF
jgi:polysaccharide export outer membrane protein